MTIPEAVQLILQASLLPRIKGGITMLEMGEPVPIMELAKNLLRLSGKSARVGRDIVITGLRPGEKLQEELATADEKLIQTGIEKVNLLDTSVVQLPELIAKAIEERRIEEVLAYLRSEIMAGDPETEVTIDVGQPVARSVGSEGLCEGPVEAAARPDKIWRRCFRLGYVMRCDDTRMRLTRTKRGTTGRGESECLS